MTHTNMSEKAQAFLAELALLCRTHHIHMTVSEYDAIQLWDLQAQEAPFDDDIMEDRTNAVRSTGIKIPHPPAPVRPDGSLTPDMSAWVFHVQQSGPGRVQVWWTPPEGAQP